MGKRLILSVAVVALTFLGVQPAYAGSLTSAPTNSVKCGEVVTLSIALTHNLYCSGSALSIGNVLSTSPITVDLDGYTVSSKSTTCAITMHDTPYLMTLENGKVIGGVCPNVGRSVLNHLVFDGKGVVAGGELDVATVENSRFLNGATFTGSGGTVGSKVLLNNSFYGPSLKSIAISITGTSEATISGNKIDGYSVGISSGFAAFQSISNNIVLDSGVGIVANFLTGIGNKPAPITGNVVAGSVGDGIDINGGVGLSVKRNTVANNGGDGIRLVPDRNTGYLQASVGDNTAIGNGNLGVEAPVNDPPDVVVADIGGNIALLNGNPLQCVNVHCSA